jgi:tetraacyldisaccharide 4'-kinase
VIQQCGAILQRIWYEPRLRVLWLLLMPLSLLFAAIVGLRRLAFRWNVLRSYRVACPVIVVGNLSVGGTGKTPFVMWLAELLQARGQRVGIVTRGYGGQSRHWPREVTANSSTIDVGDEPVMLAQRTGAIVVAGPDRVLAAQRAIELGARIVLSDDGLQHYRLRRDAEIAVLDAARGLGNRWLLPAGPLREPAARLSTVDLVVMTQRRGDVQAPIVAAARTIAARLQLIEAVALRGERRQSLERFRDRPVHALAAIGNPEAFFATLTDLGLTVAARAFPDHARLTRQDIEFGDDADVLMTEKDAVKCRDFADERHWWVRAGLHLGDADVAAVSAVVDQAILRFQRAD